MRFSKDTILSIDAKDLSVKEREQLVRKFFEPESIPDWKAQLRDWQFTQRDRRVWEIYSGEQIHHWSGTPYHFGQKHLILRGTALRPKSIGTRVTDFTKWVFSLYQGSPDQKALDEGKQIERSIAKLARPPGHPDWELVYRDPLNGKPPALAISGLTVNGKSLWGAPDLVYRHKLSGEVVIVERKSSNRVIPSDGWPNLRAQLWAYGYIDQWRDAPKITLVGEVWGFNDTHISRRAIIRWPAHHEPFRKDNAELFELYRGTHPQLGNQMGPNTIGVKMGSD